jgi:CubicO group peptidase (beta-lactamase class C family)
VSAPSGTPIQFASARTDGGYTIEAVLPWSNLGMKPRDGQSVKFQLYAFHTRRSDDINMASWYPDELSWESPTMTYTLNCTADAGAPVNCAGRPEYTSSGRLLLHVYGTADLAGESFEVANPRSRNAKPATGALALEGDRSEGSCDLTDLVRAGAKVNLDLRLTGNTVGMISALSFNDRQCDILERLHPVGNLIFAGRTFPSLKWEHPELARAAFGNESMSVTFYDQAYQPVTSAARPGRYGAVVSATTSGGFVTRRFVTLCRAPDRLGDWELARDGIAAFPAALAKVPLGMSEFPRTAFEYPVMDFAKARLDDSDVAICAANALEVHPSGDPWLADNQWWIGLKRALYGYRQDAQTLLDEIKPTATTTIAPRLVIGTPEAAGMDPAVVGELDAICAKAAGEFPAEPMSYCFARNGVVFFNKGYGKLANGQAVTADSPTLITSAGKVFAGILGMMLEEHHLLDLDAPLDNSSPVFQSRGQGQRKSKLTLRHLFTHMSGINDGLTGGHSSDLEEVIADEAPFLPLMTERYSSEGYDFIGNLMEDELGLPIAKLNKELLFEPLGIGGAEQVDAAGGGELTALELATIGQMLLNRGSYGNLQWMRPDTFDKMLPIEAWGVRGGIGFEWLGDGSLAGQTVLPKNTFGHQMGDSGIFRMVPDDGLILVWSPQYAGPRALGQKYNELIFRTILNRMK